MPRPAVTPEMEYTLVRSRRRTLAIEVKKDGTVTVRAPQRCGRAEIEAFVRKYAQWAEKKREEILSRRAEPDGYLLRERTPAEIRILTSMAKNELPERTAYFAEKIGVGYGRITIRHQKTRWGSCSSKGNLNFNCLMMLTPPDIQDYIIVHELCHRIEMNHSPRFWAQVGKILPDYRERRKWLREHT